jgi:hypothetical protein
MELAVSRLNEMLGQRTNHSTKAIITEMTAISNAIHLFTTMEAHQDFAQKCRNFEIFSEQNRISSWGRKKFEYWWNNEEDATGIFGLPKMVPFEGGNIPLPPGDEDAPPYVQNWQEKAAENAAPTVEYTLEIWCVRTSAMLDYIPVDSIPPLYPEGSTFEVNDNEYYVMSTHPVIQRSDDGRYIKYTHQIRVGAGNHGG